jgi:hypothetical protein
MQYDSLAAAPPRAVRLVAVAGGVPIWAIGSSSDIGTGLASKRESRINSGNGHFIGHFIGPCPGTCAGARFAS